MLSKQIHWFVEIEEPSIFGEKVSTRACPYLNFDAANPDFITINQFAEKAASEAFEEWPSQTFREEATAYLKNVCTEFGKIDKEDAWRTKANPSGTLMVAISKKGEVCWLAIPGIEYAFMRKAELAIALDLVKQEPPKYEKSPPGFGFGY